MNIQALRHSSTHVIEGDLVSGAGVCEYPGEVVVHGNVQDGCLILAEGNVEIHGYVGAAAIRTPRSITVHRGVAGQGYLDAGGDIHVPFIHNSELLAGGDIHISTSAMHSKLSAEGRILVIGKQGFLVGGSAKATQTIHVNRLGSIHGTPTHLRVGLSPLLQSESTRLEKEIARMNERLDALQKDIAYLKEAGERSAYADRFPLYRLRASCLENELSKQSRRYQITRNAMKEAETEGDIEVDSVVYPGVSLTINAAEHTLVESLHHIRFFEQSGCLKWMGLGE